jgi:Na+/H+ antiporter NhaA
MKLSTSNVLIIIALALAIISLMGGNVPSSISIILICVALLLPAARSVS